MFPEPGKKITLYSYLLIYIFKSPSNATMGTLATKLKGRRKRPSIKNWRLRLYFFFKSSLTSMFWRYNKDNKGSVFNHLAATELSERPSAPSLPVSSAREMLVNTPSSGSVLSPSILFRSRACAEWQLPYMLSLVESLISSQQVLSDLHPCQPFSAPLELCILNQKPDPS